MRKILEGIMADARFFRDHELQPGWYKILKVVLLLGSIGAAYRVFGGLKTLVFFGSFFLLSLGVHLIYRVKTKQFSESWLDFIVEEQDGKQKPTRIGGYYYLMVLMNGLLSYLLSWVLFR